MSTIEARALQPGQVPITGVKNLIGIAAGKGGVGKSTVAVAFAKALARTGARVGVMDADIYGPSVPYLLGVAGERAKVDAKRFVPLAAQGLQVQSMACLVGEGDPLIWRGPMASKAVEQLAYQTIWGDLDYLIVDLPPGTADIALTVCKKLPLTAVMLVTTPHPVALLDVKRCHEMMKKMHIPVLGVVENMAYFQCDGSDVKHFPFQMPAGEQGLAAWLAQEDVQSLAAMPFGADVTDQPAIDALWDTLAERSVAGLCCLPVRRGVQMPPVVAA